MLSQLDSSITDVESTKILVSSSGQSTTVSLVSDLASIMVVDDADATPAPELAGSVRDCTVPVTASATKWY